MVEQIINVTLFCMIFVSLFSAIYFFLVFFDTRNPSIYPKNFSPKPFVTILVPAYNEEDCLEKTVQSLVDLDYPKDKYEIIILNDGSKDRTPQIADDLVKKFEDTSIRVFHLQNGGKGKALNIGISHAKGEFIGCLDADSFVEPQSLAELVRYFADPKVMSVTPAMKVHNPQNTLQRIQQIEYMMGIFLRKVFSYVDAIHVTPGPFSFFRKSFFNKYGGYDEKNMTEDIEVALRIQSNKYRIENCLDAVVYTNSPPTLKELNSQRKRWYSGFISNILNYKHLFSPKYGVMGWLILPLALLSIFFAFLSFGIFMYFQGKYILRFIENYLLLGFDFFRLFQFEFDIYFFTLTPLTILAYTGLILGIVFIILSARVAKDKGYIYNYILFALTYWALYAYWWANAIYSRVVGSKVSWGNRKL
jgi:cellulose synthase/poly-beta-1,6-N-acetylglucosamine synthase-like glycosyltransferase